MDYGMMIGVNTPSTGRLPSGYTELEWIESTGTQYVDTGLSMPTGFHAVMDVEITKRQDDRHACLIGAHEVNSPYYRNFFAIYKDVFKWNLGAYGATNFGTITLNTKYNIDVCNIEGSIYCTIDGVAQTIPTRAEISSARSSRSLYLFANNYSGNLNQACMRLYTMKIYSSTDESNLVGDFIPARRDSDGHIGMYNVVKGEFHGNLGTGSFIAGSALGVDVAREVEQIFVEGEGKALIKTNLYDYGNEYTDLTGGWGEYWHDTGWWNGYCGTGDRNSDHMLISFSGSVRRAESVATVNKINTVGFTSLCVEFEVSSLTNCGSRIGFGETLTCVSEGLTWYTGVSSSTPFNEKVVIRVHNIPQGNYHIVINSTTDASNHSVNYKIYKVWLEGESETVQSHVTREVTDGWVEVDLVARQFFHLIDIADCPFTLSWGNPTATHVVEGDVLRFHFTRSNSGAVSNTLIIKNPSGTGFAGKTISFSYRLVGNYATNNASFEVMLSNMSGNWMSGGMAKYASTSDYVNFSYTFPSNTGHFGLGIWFWNNGTNDCTAYVKDLKIDGVEIIPYIPYIK